MKALDAAYVVMAVAAIFNAGGIWFLFWRLLPAVEKLGGRLDDLDRRVAYIEGAHMSPTPAAGLHVVDK